MLIKPFVVWVEGGYGDVEDSHHSDGPMAAAGLDKDGGERFDGDSLAVKLHLAGALQDKVDLGQFLVIMYSRILLNIDHVHRGGGIVRNEKRPFRKAAWTRYGANLVESCNHVVRHKKAPDPIFRKRLNLQSAHGIFCWNCAI